MKLRLIISIIGMILIVWSCDKDERSTNIENGLPTEFPLVEGTAWQYERIFYTDGVRDSSYFDTLYIAGMYKDYYLYTWDPKSNYSLVKNENNKFVYYGLIYLNDTSLSEKPTIWLHYGINDCLDFNDFEGYNYYYDSTCITIQKDMNFLGANWDTYIMTEWDGNNDGYKITYYNKLGFTAFEYYDENDIMTKKGVMTKVFKNITIPEMKESDNKGIRKSCEIYSSDSN